MEKLIIFGAGEGGKKVASILIGSLNYEIIAFADNNPVKQKKSIFGIPIIGPKGFFSQKFDRIIISSIYAKDIYIQLIDLGIPEKKLVVMFLDHSKPLDEQLRSAGLTIENGHRCKNIDSLSETKVVIWGTDHNAIKAWAEIGRSDKIYINNFISENKNVIGNLLFDVKIISPQQLLKSKYDWIINTSLKNEELKYRLSEYGITSLIVFTCNRYV